jgi:2-desacetyl-2-hydroxyethyl bacteriochlorophyllide A dehydrogenase
MRAICFDGLERVDCREIPDPELESETDVIVAVDMAGLCGSDLHVYHGREAGLDRGTVMGHEMVGRVFALGSGVRTLRIGDRVAAPFSTNCGDCFFCRSGLTSRCSAGELFGWRQNHRGLHGCQAEFVRVPLAESTLVNLDEQISNPGAILLGDNLSTGFYCADLSDARNARVSVVVGCGTVGLLSIAAAKSRGCPVVFAIDQVPHRREFAAGLGAIPLEPVEAPERILAATAGRGADSVLEVVGLPAAQQLAFELLRPGGTMGVVGCHCAPSFAFSPVQAYNKNLTYRTGRCPARAYMERLLPNMGDPNLAFDSLITHTFSFADCQAAYELFAFRRENCLKVAFVP